MSVSKADYLKKYLAEGEKLKKKKKSKKSSKTSSSKVKIIDDEVVVNDRNTEIEEELLFGGEDAPQVVEMYDTGDIQNKPEFVKNTFQELSKKSIGSKTEESRSILEDLAAKRKSDHYSQPPGRKDISPARKSKSRFNDHSPPRKRESASPVWRDKKDSVKRDRDTSPPRRRTKSRFSDCSPDPSLRQQNDDSSPLRKEIIQDHSPKRRVRSSSRQRSSDNSPPRRYKDKDNSPPRKYQGSDDSPRRRHKSKEQSQGKDNSPPRRHQGKNNSPPRRYQGSDHSPPRRQESKDTSPPRRNPFKTEPGNYSPRKQKMSDGKLSGLQNAVNLKTEIKNLKSREDEIFQKMSSEFSGRDAEIQTRKTSRKRAQESPTKLLEKEKRDQENKAKYTRWGKGLKQIEAIEQKVQDFNHEASKPLARYSNDEDLEEMLKQQERAGDPMLQYMRQQKEKKKDPKTLSMPTYQGPYPENRFNIRPGYRWDGLDRSNGYEKKLFDYQNTKRADRDDTYKYSTEDM